MDVQDEIAKVAYELYEQNGCVPGNELENWLNAEKIVAARYGQTSGKIDKPKAAAKMDKPTAAARPALKKTASRF
ncbi:MAG: DUF2934 domain-containing protein [Deltaproteobacteria bacterium]|nr:DUF2934 domain-containing protein [Deltaproteobacteria bacterium]